MPSLYTEIQISAPRSTVWRALVRKDEWLKWNTFLYDRDPAQPFEQGQRPLLSLKRISQEQETEFKPLITLLQPEVCLQWITTLPGFRIEHVFELQDVGQGLTKYTHRENLSGVLSGVFLTFFRQDEQQGLRRMAQELKRYAEWQARVL